MRLRLPRWLLVSTVFAMLAGAVGQEADTPPEVAEAPVAPAKGPVAHTLYGIIRLAWRAKKFADIDGIAERVIQDHSLDKWARAELEDVFQGLDAEFPKHSEGWPAYLATFDQWMAAAPTSTTAPIAKAEALMRYAWNARGRSGAGTVTKEGWQLFAERLNMARTVLEAAKWTAARNPHWYAATIHLARGQSWPRAAADALAQQGIAEAPWYQPTYQAMTVYLLPRWFGKPGEWQTFARKAVQAEGVEAAFMYSCIVGRMASTYSDEELFLTPDAVDWPFMRSGFDEAVRRYPEPLVLRHYFRAACLAGDRDKAREILARDPFATDIKPFTSEGEVASWKAWSGGGPLPPLRAAQEGVFEAWKALQEKNSQAARVSM